MQQVQVRNTRFCLHNGLMLPTDVRRLSNALVEAPKVGRLATEFGADPRTMAMQCLDAGIAFMRVRLLVGDAAGSLFSPPPIPDCGWDVMADNPGERGFYEGFCQRLCAKLGVPPVVLEHVKLTGAQRVMARDTLAVARVVKALYEFNVPFVSAHWPLDAAVACGTTGDVIQCHVAVAPLPAAA